MRNTSLSVQLDISRVTERSERVRYDVYEDEHEKRYSISTRNHVLFCLLYRLLITTFLKISKR